MRKTASDIYKAMASDLESLQHFVPATSSSKIEDLITRVNVEINKFKLLVPNTPVGTPTL